MQPQLANLVFPVFQDAIGYRARLLAGSRSLKFEQVQASLRSALTASQDASFLGRGPDYLGVRYALTCWVDELFVLHSPWGAEWMNNTLEWELYKTSDGGFKFWDQLDLAAQMSEFDALEVFYLCVMLGFRGTPPEKVGKLEDWRAAMEEQLHPDRANECELPPERPAEVNAPPRTARDDLHSATMILVGTMALLVPIIIGIFLYK